MTAPATFRLPPPDHAETKFTEYSATAKSKDDLNKEVRDRFMKIPAVYRVHTFDMVLVDQASWKDVLMISDMSAAQIKAASEELADLVDTSNQHDKLVTRIDLKEYKLYITLNYEKISGDALMVRFCWFKEALKGFIHVEYQYGKDVSAIRKFSEDRKPTADEKADGALLDTILSSINTGAPTGLVPQTKIGTAGGSLSIPAQHVLGMVSFGVHLVPFRYFLPQVYRFYVGSTYSPRDFEYHPLPESIRQIITRFVKLACQVIPAHADVIRLITSYNTITLRDTIRVGTLPIGIRCVLLAMYRCINLGLSDKNPQRWEEVPSSLLAKMFAAVDAQVEEYLFFVRFQYGSSTAFLDTSEAERALIAVANWNKDNMAVADPQGNLIVAEAAKLAKERKKEGIVVEKDTGAKQSQKDGSPKKQKKVGDDKKKCHKCGKKGHISAHCPEREARRKRENDDEHAKN